MRDEPEVVVDRQLDGWRLLEAEQEAERERQDDPGDGDADGEEEERDGDPWPDDLPLHGVSPGEMNAQIW